MKENSIGDIIEEKYTRYINCETDILELTIEEAIFILEKNASVHYVEDLLQEAYKVILLDYKRVLKENEELKNEVMEKDLELIGKEEYTKASMGEIIEHYYTANEDCIPISVIQNKIEELKIAGVTRTLNNENELIEEHYFLQDEIDVLQELLEREE